MAARYGARVISVDPGRASRARNAGARAAFGRWLAFVDADCELPANWLVQCSRHFEDPAVLAAGSTMRAPAQQASWVERAWYAIAHCRLPEQPVRVRWLPSFNMLVRRTAFEALSGFKENLVTCEDCDLGYRLAVRGALVLDPAAPTAHHGESQTLWQLFRREAWRSHGNLQLAAARLTDLRNWISLLLPVASVAGLAGAMLFAVAASRNAAWWPWSLACWCLFLAPFGLVTLRLLNRTSARMYPRILVVFAVYLAARSAGLFLSVPRVARPEA
jgi:GT2 family glycosyltransferase